LDRFFSYVQILVPCKSKALCTIHVRSARNDWCFLMTVLGHTQQRTMNQYLCYETTIVVEELCNAPCVGYRQDTLELLCVRYCHIVLYCCVVLCRISLIFKTQVTILSDYDVSRHGSFTVDPEDDLSSRISGPGGLC